MIDLATLAMASAVAAGAAVPPDGAAPLYEAPLVHRRRPVLLTIRPTRIEPRLGAGAEPYPLNWSPADARPRGPVEIRPRLGTWGVRVSWKY